MNILTTILISKRRKKLWEILQPKWLFWRESSPPSFQRSPLFVKAKNCPPYNFAPGDSPWQRNWRLTLESRLFVLHLTNKLEVNIRIKVICFKFDKYLEVNIRIEVICLKFDASKRERGGGSDQSPDKKI